MAGPGMFVRECVNRPDCVYYHGCMKQALLDSAVFDCTNCDVYIFED
jgi:hypothetical protein